LPAVVTISLALGVQRMIKRNALIRKLPSVETLGGTTVICSDKTGTLTKNEMTVKKVFVDNTVIDVSGSGYEPEGDFSEHPDDLDLLLKIGVLNNDAKLEKEEGSGFKIIGDPTEGSLIVSGEKAGFNHLKIREENPRIDEILFDSTRKRMTTVHKMSGKKIAYVKGAPDVILRSCDKIILKGKVKKLDTALKNKILKTNEDFSGQALRVLGFAYKELKKNDSEKSYEKNLVFVGLQGMIDPPRQEVKDAIAKCRTAGIKVVMITGDYRGTAVAIARELGIEGKAVTGEDLEKIDLDKDVENIGIYARVNPEHKMQIVDALKKKGHIVAMTGDGVNDAPALKASDIGISMGITGTDVAKEASDMILTDDNFASIVGAVEEGRGIYDNIKKFMQYLLSSNLGEVLVLFLATILANVFGYISSEGNPLLPLIPVQILWMNLITDGLPAVALGVDPSSVDIMKRKPRNTQEGILTKAFGAKVFFTGILIAFATLFVFWYFMNIAYVSDMHAQTMAFTTLVILQFVRIYIIRSEYKLGLFSNMALILAIISSIALQLLAIYVPAYTFLPNVFKTAVLSLADWGFLVVVAVSMLVLSMIVNKLLPALGLSGD
ncbi:HAD-IC family P-type ATPase, partial [Candidatus Woesearchaeota archaeon]|nr:HAD-IC family P-type ATPase [Candidatus Woesearchaeota archaeon]